MDERTRRLRELQRYRAAEFISGEMVADASGRYVRLSDVEAAVLDTEGDRPAQKTWCQMCGTACAVYCDACHEVLFHADTEGDASPAPSICPSHICPVCYHEKDRCSHCDTMRPALHYCWTCKGPCRIVPLPNPPVQP
jgi:hypothetical protein